LWRALLKYHENQTGVTCGEHSAILPPSTPPGQPGNTFGSATLATRKIARRARNDATRMVAPALPDVVRPSQIFPG
jgi:hypothetical protein